MTTLTKQAGPRNAWVDPDSGLRFYQWEGRRVPSVTSLRAMAGMSSQLVSWQLARVCDRAVDEYDALGALLARPKKPRERALEKNRRDEARRFLRQAPEEIRNRKAALGTAVHEAAELTLTPAQVTDFREVTYKVPVVEDGVAVKLKSGKPKMRRVEARGYDVRLPDDAEVVEQVVIDADDIRPRLRQYLNWLDDSRAEVRYAERQVWNLTLGYAGSFDMLVRFPNGTYWIVDIKTGSSVYAEHILQQLAYKGGEFIGEDDMVDYTATAVLRQVTGVAVLHLQDDGWEFLVPSAAALEKAGESFVGLLRFANYVHEFSTQDALIGASRKGAA